MSGCIMIKVLRIAIIIKKGMTLFLKSLTSSPFFSSNAAKYKINANFATSVGCRVKGPIPIQRDAPPADTDNPGTNTSTNKTKANTIAGNANRLQNR